MSVRKRTWTTTDGEPKQAWIVYYTDQDGDRHIKTFNRKQDAVDYQAKVHLDVGTGMHVAPSKSPTVAQAAQNWIKNVEANGRERSTLRQYKQHVNLHIVPRLGEQKLAKLTPGTIKAFRDSLLRNGDGAVDDAKRALARKVLTSLKSLLKGAGFSHVAADVKIENGKRKRKLEVGVDIPEPDEIKRLIAAAKSKRQRALLATAALTGLRASELRGLRWKDVDLKHAVLHVRQRADRFNQIGPPKSDAGSRSVPLAPELIEALSRWKLSCPKGGQAKGDDRYVFPTQNGAVWHHKNMLKSLAPVFTGAGVVDADGKPKYALHAFRHFFASWCINPKDRGGRELPPKVVQHLLGHSSIVMTLDVYGHLFPQGDDAAELAEATAALFAGSPSSTVAEIASARARKARRH
jgi:integrase